MGTMLGWRCEKCGAGESFMCGGGMLWFNEPDVVKAANDGSLGPSMRRLLGDGIPEGWKVFRENVFYRCPGCDSVIPGGTITIDDCSGGWLVYHTEPEECPRCRESLAMWDDRVPMTDDELLARCMSYVEGGCPECGGKISLKTIEWD